MTNVTLLNVYGSNIGDKAIVESTLEIFNKLNIPELHISFVTVESVTKYNNRNSTYSQTISISPYGTAVRWSKANSIKKLIIFPILIGHSILTLITYKLISQNYIFNSWSKYIKEIRNSNLIICCGGGYLRSKHSFKDFFGMLLTLMPIYIAKIYKKKIIYLPMSVGPFASNIHKYLVYLAIKNSTFYVRESVSYNCLMDIKYLKNNINIIHSPDLALMLNKFKITYIRQKYVVITARDWLNNANQLKYEKSMIAIIDHLWDVYKLRCVFIPMSINKNEDDDRKIANRLKQYIKYPSEFRILQNTNLNQILKIISQSQFTISTRLHASIFSIVTETPTICIGYEHKAKGIFTDLKLNDWQIEIESNIYDFVNDKSKLLSNRNIYRSYKNKLKNINLDIEQKKLIFINSLNKSIINSSYRI